MLLSGGYYIVNSLHKSGSTRDAAGPLGGLFEVAALLSGQMDGGLTALGLSRARAEVIWRLHELGPMTQRELSDALRCTPRNVTGLVDGLEDSGLVARAPHPTDRRATLVTLTRRGSRVADEWASGYRDLATRLFADLPATDIAAFAAVLDRVLERLRAGGESTRAAVR
jgi:DNA-binding MarR family transcriptional regulator